MLKSFEPIVDSNCKIIILGTMPGVRSLEKQEYYGHERNSFWKIICSLFGHTLITEYPQKKAFLLEQHIALWDVLKACEREGSLDSNIKNPVPNDFKSLFEKYPNIKAIYFNGEPAEKLFNRLVVKNIGKTGISQFRLPSTSPANATRFEQKLMHWNIIVLRLKGLAAGNLSSIEAHIGRIQGPSYDIIINFSSLTAALKTFKDGNMTQIEKNFVLTEDRLIDFNHRLYENGVLLWKEKYANNGQYTDGTKWHVKLDISGVCYMFSGENEYPKNWGRFCESVQDLVRESFG